VPPTTMANQDSRAEDISPELVDRSTRKKKLLNAPGKGRVVPHGTKLLQQHRKNKTKQCHSGKSNLERPAPDADSRLPTKGDRDFAAWMQSLPR